MLMRFYSFPYLISSPVSGFAPQSLFLWFAFERVQNYKQPFFGSLQIIFSLYIIIINGKCSVTRL